jgi:signal peptidase I
LSPLIPKPTTGRGAFLELVVIVALAIGLALLIQAFIVKPYQIPSESMEPTLDVGQRVLVDRVSYDFSDPGIGDIIVFHPPQGAVSGNQCGVPDQPRQACPQPTNQEADTNFIKRIVAGPGDMLKIVDGHPIVKSQVSAADWRNDVPPEEDFINPCRGPGEPCNLPEPITIPPDSYFMMGDNRAHSDDSRFWGPVPRDWIIGKAFATYWPPKRIGVF